MTLDRRSDESKEARRNEERRSGKDRRKDRRVRLSLEVAVPILVRGPDGLQRGLARNISEGGMLIEMRELPPIGAELEVTISGEKGTQDAPTSVTLSGEVRHHVAWQHVVRGEMRTMKGIGVRFVDQRTDAEMLARVVWNAGRTLH
jgi:hypothetical protein